MKHGADPCFAQNKTSHLQFFAYDFTKLERKRRRILFCCILDILMLSHGDKQSHIFWLLLKRKLGRILFESILFENMKQNLSTRQVPNVCKTSPIVLCHAKSSSSKFSVSRGSLLLWQFVTSFSEPAARQGQSGRGPRWWAPCY